MNLQGIFVFALAKPVGSKTKPRYPPEYCHSLIFFRRENATSPSDKAAIIASSAPVSLSSARFAVSSSVSSSSCLQQLLPAFVTTNRKAIYIEILNSFPFPFLLNVTLLCKVAEVRVTSLQMPANLHSYSLQIHHLHQVFFSFSNRF